MRVLTSAALRAADVAAARTGMISDLLMEQAGRALADVVLRELDRRTARAVLVLAGNGANGGDGLACARMLSDAGVRVTCLVPGGPDAYAEHSPTARVWVDRARAYNVTWDALDEAATRRALAGSGHHVVVDAIIGTGVHGSLRPDVGTCLRTVRDHVATVVACDLPSGLDPDTGRAAEGTVGADVTVTMGCLKPGLLLSGDRVPIGRVEVASIGLAPFLDGAGEPVWDAMDPGLAADLLPKRPAFAHKGTNGRVVLWAGSTGLGGAAILAAIGAIRTGVGLLTVATTGAVQEALLAAWPQVMALAHDVPVTQEKAWTLTEGADAVGCGPGLGVGGEVAAIVSGAIRRAQALVLDADALNWVAVRAGKDPGIWQTLSGSLAGRRHRLVLTPHPGEALRLLRALPHPPGDRGRSASEGALTMDWLSTHLTETGTVLAQACGGVVVLKGHPTLTCCADGRVTFNRSGGSGLATGGTGDLLTGMIATFLGQGLDAYDSARLGAYVHGLAGDLASGDGPSGGSVPQNRGITVTEVADKIPAVLARLGRVAP